MKRLSIITALPLPVGLLLLARLAGLLASPIEGYRGFGDFANFFQIVRLPGWPYLNFWVEFPPVWPFLSAALFRLAGGRETTYDYLLALILICADAGNLLLFIRLSRRIFGIESERRVWIYLVVLVSVVYTWWYFDPLAVLAQVSHIGDDVIDPQHVVIREHQAGIHNQDLPAKFVGRHVAAHFPQSPKGNDT